MNETPPRTWRLLQFGLADLLLLMAVVGAWVGYTVNSRREAELRARIETMRKATGELFIENESALYAVGQTCFRYPDEAWSVFLPEDREYQLRLGVRGIPEQEFPTADVQITPLAAGRHRIELRHMHDERRLRYLVEVDGNVVFDVPSLHDNNGRGRRTSSTGVTKTQVESPVHRPLILKRQRNHSSTPTGAVRPKNDEAVTGLMLWITLAD